MNGVVKRVVLGLCIVVAEHVVIVEGVIGLAACPEDVCVASVIIERHDYI